ncbi:hypothetical protein BDA96_05G011100 [Sorghum bicolor]|uniref:Uncharacterized protein n=1 Tax=Sorghum bicolor TaxID=4558 RepID=A0A921UDX1_SORBI|nr:hypothetical protein BDA96_05G011100 [Sorghum bicolor]
MEGVIAAAAEQLRLGNANCIIVIGVRVVGPAALPPVINLSHPYKPDLCATLVRSSTPVFDRLAFKPTNLTDPSQQFQPVLHDDDDDDSQGCFQLFNSHYGVTVNIGHLQSLMLDPSFFHPAAWPNPACWKAVIVKQDTGDEVAAGVVFANALKSQVFTLKIAQFMGDDEVAAMQGEDAE